MGTIYCDRCRSPITTPPCPYCKCKTGIWIPSGGVSPGYPARRVGRL